MNKTYFRCDLRYQVKEQRLALALDQYTRLNDAYKDKSSSRTSRE
jgi:transcription elongation factor Elf1